MVVGDHEVDALLDAEAAFTTHGDGLPGAPADDAEQSARTRRDVLAAHGGRILGAGHFPGAFGDVVVGTWMSLD